MFVEGKKNASEVVKELQESEGVNVSEWTMRRALKQVGLSSRVKQKKSKLSSKHIRDCLDFAKRHQNLTVSNWERVIFLKLIVSILMGDLGVGFVMVSQVLMYKRL